ncbi:hypothetical protein [Rhizosaccharibacter radicis]|uniref:Glycosyltransferase RgtA/B/C/D-like domain-containing protein n=1 Tax=Rhizosaccharibacter radicis TaxID=2782605 RepID=A0ABT1VVN1_9PROT|nr:hypothetical protein [Acetobacteraceae bacterium KSS12]
MLLIVAFVLVGVRFLSLVAASPPALPRDGRPLAPGAADLSADLRRLRTLRHRRGPSAWERAGRRAVPMFVAAAFALAAWRFLALHAGMTPRAVPELASLHGSDPVSGPDMRWWNWWDQWLYLRAALAWGRGLTDPALHWYLPGYPLLGAPFTRLTPLDPFLLPNLACFLAALACCMGLGCRLLDAGRWSVPLGAAAFAIAAALPTVVTQDWITPWSTTPETPCFLGALWLMLGIGQSGRPVRHGIAAGVLAGLVGGFRPADGLVILAVVVPGSFWLAGPRRPWGARGWRAAASVAAGASMSLGIMAAAYLAVWGPHPSPYVASSGKIGFEFGLLRFRWVSMMINPAPLLPDGIGLAQAFPWIVAGAAGLAASLIRPGRAGRAAHGLVGAALAGDLVLFLCYRDLHPVGLWRFQLHHYFKTVLLLFALYAGRLVVMVVAGLHRSRRADIPAAIAGVGFAVALFNWHFVFVPVHPLPRRGIDGIVIPGGFRSLSAMVLVPGHGSTNSLVAPGRAVRADGRPMRFGKDVVAYDPGDALRVLPLRLMPPSDTVLLFGKGTAMAGDEQPMLGTLRLRWGLPPHWFQRAGAPPP